MTQALRLEIIQQVWSTTQILKTARVSATQKVPYRATRIAYKSFVATRIEITSLQSMMNAKLSVGKNTRQEYFYRRRKLPIVRIIT